tara:strand:+ start:4248 stop:5024 length:777 start_codon:yes stop_codon:yes gene_type:complete
MLDGLNIGTIIMQVIRVLWGNSINDEIPKFPLLNNEVVYVWGDDNNQMLLDRGYKTRLLNTSIFEDRYNHFGKKLFALNEALKEFSEVLLLDWDCYMLKPLDEYFYNSLKEKPIQIPLYIQHKDTKDAILEILPPNQSIELQKELDILGDGFKKYGWEWEDGFVAPNFGFVYCRDVKLGAELLKIAQRENLQTVVDEFATLLYVNCSLDEYIKKYLPSVVRGSSNDKFILDKRLHILCKKFNDYVDTQIELKPYFEHV